MREKKRRIKGYKRVKRGDCKEGDMVWHIEHSKPEPALGLIGRGIEYCSGRDYEVYRERKRLTPPQKVEKKVKKVVIKYSKYDWTDNHIVLNLLDELRDIAGIKKEE